MQILDREQFCNEILKTDDKIRFAAIYDEGEFYHKMREGLNSYLTPEETENSLAQAVYRWNSRKKAGTKIGEPIYAMAKYGKVYRITIPVGKAGLIIVTTELNVNVEEIVEKVIETRDKNYQ
ncbi:MAG: hypothetical protein IH780_02975 [Thaumarchaeota archaeon]|nr:hypothetical protein [Nitrososphaerota archaeon]